MPRYKYEGKSERIFPSVPIVVSPGEEFDSLQELHAPGLSIIADKKTEPAVEIKKEKHKEQKKSETTIEVSDAIVGE